MTTSPDGGGIAQVTVENELTDDGLWIRLRGTADLASLTALNDGLATVDLDGQKNVRIDVSDVDFVDVAALRQLVRFAIRTRQQGRVVTTCGARPMLHRMARILDLRDHLGLS